MTAGPSGKPRQSPARTGASGGGLALTSAISSIPGVAPARAEALATLGLRNVGQLLAHLPLRHEQLEAERPIAECAAGVIVSARGEVVSVSGIARGRARQGRFSAAINDGTGRLDLVWFNMPYMREKLHPGVRVRVQGKAVKSGPVLQIINPRTIVVRPGENEPGAERERLRAVYPAGEAVYSSYIEQAMGRAIAAGALDLIEDPLPTEFRRERAMPALAEAYRLIHQPETHEDALAGRRRLAYDELLHLQVALATARAVRVERFLAPALKWNTQIDEHIRRRLPFALTAAQERVVAEIAADLSRDVPANRLVQGDVGSGKTVVALYAMLMAVAGRHQGALMAPTEMLAEQHAASIRAMLKGSDVRVRLLTGSMEPAVRARVLREIERGEADIMVGTHALLTEAVRFKSLAVAVVDEQHKFGVHQRATLRSRGEEGNVERPLTPHVLVMTATPIPRTLAMSLLGDLDVSTIDELPPGRKPIATRIVTPDKQAEVLTYVRTRLDKGEQAYIVVPAIEPGADLFTPEGAPARLATVREVMQRLEAGPLAGKRLASMHGRLNTEEREGVMQRFRKGEIDALVATTVIEVGVDVPNATVMVVLDAERFGLAQLHQLRGRVGRGSRKSACILIGNPATPEAEQRLQALADTSDGFRLAEVDLAIRGFGDVAGVRQSGAPPFRVADLTRDMDLLTLARRDASLLVGRKVPLDDASAAVLRRRVLKTHGRWLGLADTA